jgi:hypothetical protein
MNSATDSSRLSFVGAEPKQLKLQLLVVRWAWICCNVGATLAMKHKSKLVVRWAQIWWCDCLHGAKRSLVSNLGKQRREHANTPRPLDGEESDSLTGEAVAGLSAEEGVEVEEERWDSIKD